MRLDTAPDIFLMQAAIYRRLGAQRRLELACQMSETVRDLARARIRAKHPDLDETGIREVLIWELYGIRRPAR